MGAATTNFLLLLLLSYITLSTAITIPPNIDPKIFSVQPIKGGSAADDCGDGHPVTFDEASWAANDVDSAIASVWSVGKPDPNFDFHQTFARKYGVSLYCPNIFSTCTGDPSACSALKGTVAEKKQGWMGIKAILNLQEQFLQFEKAMTQVVDGLTADLASFRQAFAPPTPPDKVAGRNAVINFAGAVFQGVIAGVAAVIAGVGALVAGVGSVAASAWNDNRSDNAAGSTDFSILTLSDARGAIKNSLLTGLDLAHNATFSNGFAGKYPGPEILTVLKGGAFAGNLVPQAYSSNENNLEALMQRVMASKLLEATWSFQNTILFRIGTVTDPGACAKWYPKLPDLRFCNGDRGLFVLRNVAKDTFGKMRIGTPSGSNSTAVASIGGYDIQLPDLLKSASDRYMDHGLYGTDFNYFLPGILYGWQVSPTNTVFKWEGIFSLPVCEITEAEWADLDEGAGNAPCSCLKSVDQWGQKFLDYAPDLMKTYITSRTTC
ncbi:MAG: hypothetical protein M1839_004743 [Geoglossum umbratile]|nr:MAG: hypothetical protein M1839_004743 [Geoglossum umbratile]